MCPTPDPTGSRVKMTKKEMYDQSKRYWDKLSEVREQVAGRKRRAEAATNRLRVKLYQKVRAHSVLRVRGTLLL